MQLQRQNAGIRTPQQISEFWKGSAGIEFSGQSRAEIYGWTERRLVAQEYPQQGKKQRGVIRSCRSKGTGLSRPPIRRRIGGYRQTGQVKVKPSRRRRFARRYTEQDVARWPRWIGHTSG